ncbi:hypothetical protein EMIT0158MI4_130019 [Burkholderia ambifaria]
MQQPIITPPTGDRAATSAGASSDYRGPATGSHEFEKT